MDQQDEETRRSKVVEFSKYRGMKGKRRGPAWDHARAEAFASSVDDATRDLHAAASMTMKMVYLARDRMGLPPI
jgi:hypothetical protein